MIYTEDKDKEAIVTAVNVFLVSKGTTLRKVALEMNEKPNDYWQKLNRGSISEDFVNKVVKHVDPNCRLQKFHNSFMVTSR